MGFPHKLVQQFNIFLTSTSTLFYSLLNMPNGHSQWHNLPTELLHKISSDHLHTHIDHLRFRSICSSWRRSSTAPPPSRLPSKLPYPLNLHEFKSANHQLIQLIETSPLGYYRLTQSVVYLVQNPLSDSSGTSWLVKLEEGEEGRNKSRVLSPVSDNVIKNVGREFNLLDFRFIEICKAYYVKYVSSQKHEQIDNPKKVLFLPEIDGEYTVIALDKDGGLYYVKKGDEEWTKFGFLIEDIVIYKGRLHSVDPTMYTSIYDSSYKNQTLISNWWEYGRGSKTVLLENCGSLLSVDIELDVDSCSYDLDPDDGPVKMSGGSEFRTAVKMKIYILNEEKRKWEVVESLGDRILFLGNDCSYSVSAKNFPGCKGNVVYHADEGIELKFEKDKPKVCYSDGCDDFIVEQGDDDEPSDDEYGGYGHNYWISDGSSSSDDDNSWYPGKAYDEVRGASDDALKELQGQNIGVFDVENGRLGSLLMFREGASAFWPPPVWFKNNLN